MLSDCARAYANLHLKSLRDSNPVLLKQLESSGSLQEHLDRLGEQADELYHTILANGSTDPKLPREYYARVRALESLPLIADETVLNDIVYQPLPSAG